jgi:histidyl-tRNA synthetase
MKPSLPKGTRDFGPREVYRRDYIFRTIQHAFERYGYAPIETPAMENLQTLTGKYGEEGDQLLFKVLNNGDFLAKADPAALAAADSQRLAPSIAKRGMRYDLTIPFARYVVMNQHALHFPFKRYQIQPVWRADRPQKGRYQEFYQCDADVIGSASLVYEAELIRLYDEVFTALGIRVDIRYNHRKMLSGLASVFGLSEQFTSMTIALDKLDKVGWDGVRDEMARRGVAPSRSEPLLSLIADPDPIRLRETLSVDVTGQQGIRELDTLQAYLSEVQLNNSLSLDLTLARGLNYYTGTILEVKACDTPMGSIGGGGRYADLTGMFGLSGLSGVGISFGADRIYDVMEALDLFPEEAARRLDLLAIVFEEKDISFAFGLIQKLREAGIPADMYPEAAKPQKMLKYANAVGARHVLILGPEECTSGQYTLKNMETGAQLKADLPNLITSLREGQIR